MGRLGRIGTALVAALVIAGGLAVPSASSAPVSFSPTPVSGWSTNAPVHAVLIVGNTVYVGGDFTQVRPPGGGAAVNRARLAAFDIHTGALRTAFSADASARVETLATDGTRLFVGGSFTQIKGVNKSRLAAVDLTTGNVFTGFTATFNSNVFRIAVSGNRVFVGGSFTTLGVAARSRLAAVNTVTGATDPTFNPNADNTVRSLVVSPDGNTVYAGGQFTAIGGGVRANIAPLSSTTGELLPLTFQYPLVNLSVPVVIDLDISPSGDRLFAALGGFENQALSWSTVSGRRQWGHQVDGDTQAVHYFNGNVYFGFHEGDLGDSTVRMLTADAATGAVVTPYHLPIDSFFGVWNIDASADALVLGGEFMNVNGVATQGFTILPRGSNDPVAPTPASNLRVTATTNSAITLAWDAGTDDVAVAGYRVLRDGVEIAFPTGQTYTDTDLPASTDFTYQVQTMDAAGNFSSSTPPLLAGTDTTLIPAGATWKYFANGLNQGTAWRASAFDDSLWASGPAQLGYGDGDEATVVPFGPDPNNKYITTYYRRQVTIDNPATLANVNITLLRDDGAVIYVNGTEVVRSNMANGNIAFNTNATTNVEGSNETALFTYQVPPSRFVAGSNTIAVEIHQQYRSSSDTSFDLSLSTARLVGPGQPTNLHSTAVTGTSADLAWTAPSGSFTGFRVYRDGVLVGSPSGTTFSDPGLASVQSYSYTVTAVDAANLESAPSTAVAVSTPDVIAPSQPTGLAAGTVTAARAELTWSASTDNVGVTGYDVLRDGVQIGTSTTPAYTDLTVAQATTYSYTVRARDLAGNISAESDPVPVTTPIPDTTAPSVPQNLHQTDVTGTTVSLAWDASTDDTAVTAYIVSRNGVDLPATASTSLTDSLLASGVSYTYTVRATDASDNVSTASDPLVVTTSDVVAPSTPGSLTAPSVSASSVQLAWGASTDNIGVVAYDVRRDGTLIGSPATPGFTDTTVVGGQTYSYTVTARDAAGNTATSSPLSVTAVDPTPTLFADLFGGANGSAWGSGWTTSGANGTATQQSGTGQLAFTDVANAYSRAQLTGLPARADSDTTFSYRFNATSAIAYLNVYARGSGGWQNGFRPNNGYGIELRPNAAGITVARNSNGTTTTLASVANGRQVSTAKQWLRLRVVGSTIQFKSWVDGQAEPAAWTATVTDTTVTAAGQQYLSLARSSTNVGAKNVQIDDLQILPG